MIAARRIAGHLVALEKGVSYRASRPMASRPGELFTVSIARLENDEVAVTIPSLDYEEANRFLRAFNNRRSSFAGRVW